MSRYTRAPADLVVTWLRETGTYSWNSRIAGSSALEQDSYRHARLCASHAPEPVPGGYLMPRHVVARGNPGRCCSCCMLEPGTIATASEVINQQARTSSSGLERTVRPGPPSGYSSVIDLVPAPRDGASAAAQSPCVPGPFLAARGVPCGHRGLGGIEDPGRGLDGLEITCAGGVPAAGGAPA